MHRSFLALLMIVFCVSASFAQQAGIHLGLAFPQDEFKEKVSRTGVGLTGDILVFRTGPASMGINLGYFSYGNESRRERFSTTIPDVTVDVSRSNNIFNFHLLFHVAPDLPVVIPYAEALFGGSYLFTETKIDNWNGEDVTNDTNFDDFAWSYGAGGGLLIHLYSDPWEIQFSEIMLDIKVRYIFGTEAEYLKEGSVYFQNGYAYYQVEKSKTDILTATAGVTFKFNAVF